MAKFSRDKGKRGERLWAAYCRDHGYDGVRRAVQYCGSSGEAADCVGLPGVHQEVKFVERLNVWEAMEQSIRDSEAAGQGDMPIVAHKKSRSAWLVTMRAADFFQLYHGRAVQ